MGFWSGVVQGVKDVDVLKEKEALADERQGVRDQENAYRDRMAGIQQTQWAAANARAEEKWAYERAAMGQSVRDAANGLGIGGSPAGGGGGGGSVPTPDAIKDSGVQFGGWLDTQLSDDTLSQEDVDYLTNVSESFVDLKDAHEYWGVVTGIRETTGQMPTVAQLRASVSVTQIPGYADNKAKAVETLASINSMDVSTPEGLAQATTLYNQLKRIDLNAATIDADLSGFLTEEDLGNLHTRQVGILDTELATNWLSVDDKSELALAEGVSKDILMGDFRRKYGPQALEALTGLYPQQFSRYADNPAFRDIVRGPSSATPTQNGGTDEAAAAGGTGGGTVDTASVYADLSKDPDNLDLQGMVIETVGLEVFNSMMTDIKGGSPASYKEYGESRQIGATPEALEGEVHPRDLAGFTGEAREVERQRILEERAAAVEPTERALGSREGTAVQADLNEADSARRMAIVGDRSSVADRVAENAALNPPVDVEPEAPAEPAVVEAIPAGQDLTPDQSAELKVGVEELIAAIFANEGNVETITRGLNARFTQERVTEALLGVMGSNQ